MKLKLLKQTVWNSNQYRLNKCKHKNQPWEVLLVVWKKKLKKKNGALLLSERRKQRLKIIHLSQAFCWLLIICILDGPAYFFNFKFASTPALPGSRSV